MYKYSQKKRIRSFMKTFGCVFITLIFGFLIISLAIPDRSFSSSEKRQLTTIKDIDFDIYNNNLSSDFESYASDQIAGRDIFIKLCTGFKRLLGNRESQGIYYCKDGYLIEKMDELDENTLYRTIDSVNSFTKENSIPSSLVIIPNAVSVCKDKLPAFSITEDQDRVYKLLSERISDRISLYFPSDTLNKLYEDGKQVFYYSDHHWTSEAAYECLPDICKLLDITPKDFKPLLVCDSFTGSLASKSGFTSPKKDKIYIYKPVLEENYIVTYIDKKIKTASIYSQEGLASTDPYTVFLGGNASHINIKTDKTDGKRLLVFKDSYFNSFLPFIVDEFSEIDIIDPRYYYGDIKELLLEKDYDEILYFYNMNTFAGDTSLIQVIGGSYE